MTAATASVRAILFGLNYSADPANRLYGCINDVRAVQTFLVGQRPDAIVQVFDDVSTPDACRKAGILGKLRAFVDAVNADPQCTYAWIHFSGHGSQTRDRSGDESDGKDEAFVPTDFRTAGMLVDDELTAILAGFTRKTLKVVCVMDACHSGTMCDLKYRWSTPTRATLENATSKINARVLAISGCLDTQTSADAFGVLETAAKKEAGGALTGCLLNALAVDKVTAVFDVHSAILARLRANGFAQRPLITSSFNLSKDFTVLPPPLP